MKVTIQKTGERIEDEIIIRYHKMTPEISRIMNLLSIKNKRLTGLNADNQKVLFTPHDVFYFESVDGVLYAYLENEVYRIREKLDEIISQYENIGIIRCSRTMAVNLYLIERLKSEPGGRILATLQNEEQIIISRKYAGILRNKLKNGRS